MSLMPATGAAVTVGAGVVAVSQGAGGPDFVGIAAVITSVSGLIATVGAIYLGSRRRNNDATDAALRLLLEMQNKPEDAA